MADLVPSIINIPSWTLGDKFTDFPMQHPQIPGGAIWEWFDLVEDVYFDSSVLVSSFGTRIQFNDGVFDGTILTAMLSFVTDEAVPDGGSIGVWDYHENEPTDPDGTKPIPEIYPPPCLPRVKGKPGTISVRLWLEHVPDVEIEQWEELRSRTIPQMTFIITPPTVSTGVETTERVDDVEDEVTAIDTRTTTVESDIATLQTTVSSLQTTVSSMQTTVSSLGGSVTSLESDVSDLQDAISHTDRTVDSNTNLTVADAE